jgi:hypothetical protein
MIGWFEAETRSKARYKAYMILRETWDLRDITKIRVTAAEKKN